MNRKVTIHFLDGTSVDHGYPDRVIVRDGILTVVLSLNQEVAYPLTSVKSWENDR